MSISACGALERPDTGIAIWASRIAERFQPAGIWLPLKRGGVAPVVQRPIAPGRVAPPWTQKCHTSLPISVLPAAVEQVMRLTGFVAPGRPGMAGTRVTTLR